MPEKNGISAEGRAQRSYAGFFLALRSALSHPSDSGFFLKKNTVATADPLLCYSCLILAAASSSAERGEALPSAASCSAAPKELKNRPICGTLGMTCP